VKVQDVNQLNDSGVTALSEAICNGCNLDVVKLLLHHKCDPNLPAELPPIWDAATNGMHGIAINPIINF
jgi:ankyrin repeat protein